MAVTCDTPVVELNTPMIDMNGNKQRKPFHMKSAGKSGSKAVCV